jgi:hypothetical protein
VESTAWAFHHNRRATESCLDGVPNRHDAQARVGRNFLRVLGANMVDYIGRHRLLTCDRPGGIRMIVPTSARTA